MKTNFTLLFLIPMLIHLHPMVSAQTVEDADVSLSNLSSNSYFGSYDDNSKMVSDLNFMVLADGTNSSNVTPAFTVKVYIWDGSNPTFVKTYNDAGIYHFGSKTYENESVDLSNLSLPAGTYRLGVYVDADDDIPNPPDDPENNAFLLEGDIVFTPGTSTAINELEIISWNHYPNPVSDMVSITRPETNVDKDWNITIANLQGQLLRQINLTAGNTSLTIDMNNMADGIYLLGVQTGDNISYRRIVKQ